MSNVSSATYRRKWLKQNGWDPYDGETRYYAAMAVLMRFDEAGEAYPQSLNEGFFDGHNFVSEFLSDGTEIAMGYES